MKTVILQTVLPHRIGQTINLPIVGEKTFDDKGFIEVSLEEAEILLGMEEIGLINPLESAEKEVLKEEKETLESSTPSEETTAEQRKTMLKMKKEELFDIANKLELPEEEWATLKKEELVEYLLTKN